VKPQQDFQRDPAGLEAGEIVAIVARKNTDSLIGAVAKVLEEEGIQLVDFHPVSKPLLPTRVC